MKNLEQTINQIAGAAYNIASNGWTKKHSDITERIERLQLAAIHRIKRMNLVNHFRKPYSEWDIHVIVTRAVDMGKLKAELQDIINEND